MTSGRSPRRCAGSGRDAPSRPEAGPRPRSKTLRRWPLGERDPSSRWLLADGMRRNCKASRRLIPSWGRANKTVLCVTMLLLNRDLGRPPVLRFGPPRGVPVRSVLPIRLREATPCVLWTVSEPPPGAVSNGSKRCCNTRSHGHVMELWNGLVDVSCGCSIESAWPDDFRRGRVWVRDELLSDVQ